MSILIEQLTSNVEVERDAQQPAGTQSASAAPDPTATSRAAQRLALRDFERTQAEDFDD